MKIHSRYRETVTLNDGREVVIRAVQPDDKPLFVDALSRASLDTVYGRLLSARKGFSRDELKYLTEFDGTDHFALGAVDGDHGIGVARFVRIAGTDEAELAFAVDENYRQVGLASCLLRPLFTAAEERGIQHLVCLVLAENTAAITLLTREGFAQRQVANGTATFEIRLAPG
jgi:ribosomal protein S18 acetylase RimI-like enzyme